MTHRRIDKKLWLNTYIVAAKIYREALLLRQEQWLPENLPKHRAVYSKRGKHICTIVMRHNDDVYPDLLQGFGGPRIGSLSFETRTVFIYNGPPNGIRIDLKDAITQPTTVTRHDTD